VTVKVEAASSTVEST
jgi:hypothetical protein